MKWFILILIGSLLLVACSSASSAYTSTSTASTLPTSLPVTKTNTPHVSSTPTPIPTRITVTHTNQPTPSPTQTIAVTPDPSDWQNWPVIPTMTSHSLQIFQTGADLGNNPQAFSKMGDCETDTDWFLTNFDKSQAYYNLGPYEDELTEVIDYYKGSYSRDSQAAQDGGSAATLLNPMWANPDVCVSGETPLDCEIRIHKPAYAIIAVGTNDTVRMDRFEGNLRRVIERLIELGVVPILATKADNLEGDYTINIVIAQLAVEYDLMVWNFWAAVQPLPGHGLLEDGAHLTWAPNDFSDPDNLEKAWPIRNLTALQLFDLLRRSTIGIQ